MASPAPDDTRVHFTSTAPAPTAAAKPAVRTVREDDIPAIVELFERVHPEHRWPSRPACESYYRQMLFDHPWHALDVPSWLAEADGVATGFAGIMPRPMTFHGRPIRVAVGFQFMVDPARRHSLTGLQLAQSVFSGPQDLFVADGSNSQSRRLWQAIGGRVPLLHNLHWLRPLRPMRHLLSELGRRGSYRPFALAALPFGMAADAVAARMRPNSFQRDEPGIHERDVDAAEILAQQPALSRGAALQPVYSGETLDWLLAELRRKTRHGQLRARLVHDDAHAVLGWYIYYAAAGAVSELVHLAARDSAFDAVLRRLLADAWREGAVAVRGRLDPARLDSLSQRHCWLRREDPWTLIHARDPALAAAFDQGAAFVGRLDGEWWMRFQGG